MVVTGGVNVFPREIEEIVATFPGVQEVAVVGLPDEKWGECVVAVVVPRVGVELNLADLQSHVEPKLARYKQPRRWEVMGSLPRNAGGKVVKRDVISQVTSEG